MVQIIREVADCCSSCSDLVIKTTICNVKADYKLVLEGRVAARSTSSCDNLVERDVAWARRQNCKSLVRLTDEAWKSRVHSCDAVLYPKCVDEAVSTRRSLHKLCKRELDLRRVDIVVL